MGELVKGKIILYPTRTIIEPYTERNSKIENSLSVWNTVKHCYEFQMYIKDSINNRLIIPTTYTAYHLQNFYPSYKIEDKRKFCNDYMEANKTNNIKMLYDFKNDLQQKVYNILNKRNIKEKYKPMQRFLCPNTGFGKTYCAVRYISENKDRPIIFVDQDSLAQQWKDRIMFYTDTQEDEIYYISGKQSINKLFKMNSEEILNIKFFICCYRTLTTNIKNNSSSSDISKLFTHCKITLKVFDEAHVEPLSIFKIDMISNLRSIYITATPKRSKAEEDKVYQNMFLNVEKISTENIIKKKENYHNIIIYNWSSKPTLLQQSDCNTKYGFSMAKYCNYLEEYKYKLYKDLIIDIIFNMVLTNRKKKKIAILFGTLSLLNKIYDDILNYIINNEFKLIVNKFNGNTKKEDKLKLLEETDIILTTDKSFDKGMDVKNLQVLINTVPFSSETKLIQIIGRLRPIENKEVTFIDVNDIGFDGIKYQSINKKKKVLIKLAKNLFIKNK